MEKKRTNSTPLSCWKNEASSKADASKVDFETLALELEKQSKHAAFLSAQLRHAQSQNEILEDIAAKTKVLLLLNHVCTTTEVDILSGVFQRELYIMKNLPRLCGTRHPSIGGVDFSDSSTISHDDIALLQ